MAEANFLRIIQVAFGGQFLEDLTSFEINQEANPQKIVTILKGLAGKSDGPAEVNIRLTAAIPLGGPEYDFWNTCHAGSWETCQVGVGDGDYVGDGWFSRVGISASTDKAAEVSVEWTGKPGRIE